MTMGDLKYQNIDPVCESESSTSVELIIMRSNLCAT